MFGFTKPRAPARIDVEAEGPPETAQTRRAEARAALAREEAAWRVQEAQLVAAATAAATAVEEARTRADALATAAFLADHELLEARLRMDKVRSRYQATCVRHADPEFTTELQVWSAILTNGPFDSAADRDTMKAAYDRLATARMEGVDEWRPRVRAELAKLPAKVAAAIRSGAELWIG